MMTNKEKEILEAIVPAIETPAVETETKEPELETRRAKRMRRRRENLNANISQSFGGGIIRTTWI